MRKWQILIPTLFLLLIPSIASAEKDCSIYGEETLINFFQGAMCGLYNFIVAVGPPQIVTTFYIILALLIVSLFALMAYILSAGE